MSEYIEKPVPVSYWSLGWIADLLWRYSPGSREPLVESIRKDLLFSAQRIRMPEKLTASEVIWEVYYMDVLEPIRRAWPGSVETLKEELRFTAEVIRYDGDGGGYNDGKNDLQSTLYEYVVSEIIENGDLERFASLTRLPSISLPSSITAKA